MRDPQESLPEVGLDRFPIELAALLERHATLVDDAAKKSEILVSAGRVLLDPIGAVDRSQKCFERALEIEEKVLGPDHTDVAMGLNNLAVVRKKLGDYKGALPLYERALAIWRAALGDERALGIDQAQLFAMCRQRKAAVGAAARLVKRHLRRVVVEELARELLAEAHAVTQPTLVLQGDKDTVVDAAGAERLAARLGGQRTFHVIRGSDHLLTLDAQHTEVFDRVTNFLTD